jgi:hypothetical protein
MPRPEPGPVALRTRERPREEFRAVFGRWTERRECKERTAASLEVDGELDVSDVLDDGEVILTAVLDIAQHEKCLLAFRASEWLSFREKREHTPGGREDARFRVIADASRTVSVRGGTMEIPETFVAEYLDGSAEVYILRLRDHTEIWSRRTYDLYSRNVPPQITIDTTDVSWNAPAEEPSLTPPGPG